MKRFFTTLSLVGLTFGAAGFIATQGCSSSSTSGGAASAGKQPPPATGPATTSTDERTFAVNALFLGEADRNNVANKDAWKGYGYNLDGLISTKDSTDVCQPQPGASKANQEDGTEGVDNAFGKIIIPFLAPFAAAPSKSVNDSIAQGGFTIMLKIKGLTDDPAQTNTGLGGTLLIGGKFDSTGTAKPTFTTADDWPYRQNPQVAIAGAYINKGTWVNGSGGADVQLALFIQGVSIDLTIHKAIITFDHTAAKDATNGTIAGIIGTDDLINGISTVAGRISTQLCGGSTLDSIKQTIRQASDILKDGTNHAGVPCDGISVGIGFTAKQVANPTKIAPADTVPPDPCTTPQDAGADTGADTGPHDAGDQ